MQSLVDYVVEDVDEGVLGQTVRHLLPLELEGREALGDLTAQRVRLLLVLLERTHELPEQSTETHNYGFYDARSNPSFDMSILFTSNLLLSPSIPIIRLYANTHIHIYHRLPTRSGKMRLPSSTHSYLLTECAIFIQLYRSAAQEYSLIFFIRAIEWLCDSYFVDWR